MDFSAAETLQPAHGQKRPPDNELENEQRLAKRFNLLNLEHNGKLYTSPPSPQRRNRANAISDTMNVDESRDRVFIHNLDDELADADSEEEKLIFIADIEKRLTKIPKSLLTSNHPQHHGSEIVLYGVPGSLSLPKDQDNVRKAIIESRQRARENQALEARAPPTQSSTVSSQVVQQPGLASPGLVNGDTHDPDAMEIG